MHHTGGMDTELGKYFAALTGNASFRQMGQHSGINHSTIRRQLKGEGDATAALVADLTRAYGGNVLDAFVAAGFITKEEAGTPNLAEALQGASDMELAQEIVRRAASGEAGPELTEPIELEPHNNVVVGTFGQNADTEQIPENVEDEWEGEYAAYPKGDEPIDHGAP